jgi:hypothetical protein
MNLTKEQIMLRNMRPKAKTIAPEIQQEELDQQKAEFMAGGGVIEHIAGTMTPHTSFRAGGGGSYFRAK